MRAGTGDLALLEDSYRTAQRVLPGVHRLCTEGRSWLPHVSYCPFCPCLDGVHPAPVTEWTEGSGCWDVDPGIQSALPDLAGSEAGEKVQWTTC